MWLLKLDAENFRAIKKLSLEFPDDQATVFIGPNGSGKSTILDCIAILLSNLFQIVVREVLKEKPTASDRPVEPDYKWQDMWNIIAESAGGKPPDWMDYEITDVRLGETESSIKAHARYRKLDLPWSISAGIEGPATMHLSQNITPMVQLGAKIRSRVKRDPSCDFPLAMYYPPNRYVSDFSKIWDQIGFQGGQLAAYVGAFSGSGLTYREFFKWFRYREDIENEIRISDSSFRDIQMEAVRSAIEKILPDFSNPKVKRNPPRMVITKKDTQSPFETELQIEQLSGGEKGLIVLVADVARRLAITNPRHENPLHGEAVILIDEVDLHLHPEWQRMVIPRLMETFPCCQFIIGTHSPQVISEVETKSVYMLRQKNGVIEADGPHCFYGRDTNRILEETMEVPERPKAIQEKLREYFRLIDENNMDEAQKVRKILEEAIGPDEPEFASADVLLKGRELFGQ